MSDEELSGASPTGGLEARLAQTIAELTGSIRRLKRWLIALTVAVALLVAALIVAAVFVVPQAIDEQDGSAYDVPMGPGAEQVDATRTEIENALGDRLENVEVRLVTMKFEDPSMPADAPSEESFVYAEYRLKGSEVLVADIVEGPFGADPASMGMLPTQGTLQSRMTLEQFERLLAAYGRETAAPLSGVRRYNDRAEWVMPGSAQSVSIEVGDKEYRTKDLWAATEGLRVEGDTVGMDIWSTNRKALIFYEDPKSGAFTFLGTEPAFGGY